MSAYWIYSMTAEQAKKHCKEWKTVEVFTGYEWNSDWEEDQAVYQEMQVPVLNGVMFELNSHTGNWVAFGRKSDGTNHFENHDFVKSVWTC